MIFVLDASVAIAAASRLRATDACYVWAAQRHGLSLCTLDGEILLRSFGIRVYAP